jgi:DNA-binding NtrC family response regulator/tetratricopeptide (TPR) repeat protein
VLLDTSIRDDVEAAAGLTSRLGLESARRHVLVRFGRIQPPNTAPVVLESLGVTAMISMVFTDRDYGPDNSELLAAARVAGGNPGRFLSLLRASAFPEHRPTFGVVHETAPAYVVDDCRRPATTSRGRVAARSIVSAEARAARLAARGRHAAAIRLLTRAIRVLELRGERLLAAGCAERLGWILRDRGRTQSALEQFARAGALARGDPSEIRAAIATGIAWTDECRFAEAEAALRSALAAAELLRDSAAEHRARHALARCLHWQHRNDEAAVALAPNLDAECSIRVAARTLSARISLATGDLQGAVASASRALAEAGSLEPRAVAAAARAMAQAQAALGDVRAARAFIRQGLAAAAVAHAPLMALRLRSVALTLGDDESDHASTRTTAQTRAVFGRRSLPPLLRLQLEREAHTQDPPSRRHGPGLPLPAFQELQHFLELACNAEDDGAGVNAVCLEVCEKLRAATVQVLSADSKRRLLARAGRPWAGDLHLVERAIACSPAGPVIGSEQPRDAAHSINYGGQPVAVLACRWTVTTTIDVESATALIHTASLALAPTVRTLLDRAESAPAETAWRELIGVSPPTLSLRESITRAARAPFPVLIEGESGSGKELVARAIHRFSSRRDRRLCAVNCAALSEDLLEAELFGHARGAFTGAVGERPGLFEEADGGTLFLDEVGELSQRAQAKLLRVLQDGEVRRVGENFARRVDARVIAATNCCLDGAVDAGRFRADLRFRLDVVRIAVPPLRDRPVDIPLLAAHFWEDATRRVQSRASLAPETVLALTRYDWPGNVRQLQNVIASLAVHAPRRGRVPPSLLPAQVARTAGAGATTFEAARQEFERRFIAAELARAGGQRARAARALGVTRQGLAKMMRRLGIEA